MNSKIHGIDALIAIRKSGNRPALSVWIWIGFPAEGKKGPAINLTISTPSRLADIRPLVGLPVILCATEYSPALMNFFDALKAVCSSVCLWVQAWGDDVDSMIIWDKRNGQRALGECGNG